MRKVVASAPDDPQRILRVNFEDVVLGYDASLEKTMSFLGETPATHLCGRQYFQPEKSARNIGLWRTYLDQAAIALIRSELAEFCIES